MATKTKTPDYLKKIIKDYGEIIRSGTEVLEEKKNYKIISVSPAIDIALGGSIREVSWLTLTGDPKSGKTTTAMQIAANCQKEGRPIIYLDAEGRLKDMNFEVADLDPAKMNPIRDYFNNSDLIFGHKHASAEEQSEKSKHENAFVPRTL